MNNKNIAQIDLNLLVVFDVVCRERNTVRAAEKLGLSQPAISHALARLREVFADRLFVRASRGLIPTPRALELQAPIRQIMAQTEKVLARQTNFDPGSAKRIFRLATTDYFEQIAFPSLLKAVENQAPGVTIVSRPTLGELPRERLEAGGFDLAIAGFYRNIPERFFQQKLFEDDFVCVARPGVFQAKGPIAIEKYVEAKHLLISPQGDLQSKAREILERKGYPIQYLAGVTSFLSPARILNSTDLALTCPRKLALSYLEAFSLKVHELSFKIPPISVVQVWHERNQDDAAHQWLRNLIQRICRSL